MSEEITEHDLMIVVTIKDLYLLKRAFELVGQLGDFYEDGVSISESATDEEKRLHEIQEEIK